MILTVGRSLMVEKSILFSLAVRRAVLRFTFSLYQKKIQGQAVIYIQLRMNQMKRLEVMYKGLPFRAKQNTLHIL